MLLRRRDPKTHELTCRRKPNSFDLFHVRHSRSVLKGGKQSLERAAFAFGHYLNRAIREVPTCSNKLQLVGALLHEVSKPHTLHTALDDSAKAFRALVIAQQSLPSTLNSQHSTS